MTNLRSAATRSVVHTASTGEGTCHPEGAPPGVGHGLAEEPADADVVRQEGDVAEPGRPGPDRQLHLGIRLLEAPRTEARRGESRVSPFKVVQPQRDAREGKAAGEASAPGKEEPQEDAAPQLRMGLVVADLEKARAGRGEGILPARRERKAGDESLRRRTRGCAPRGQLPGRREDLGGSGEEALRFTRRGDPLGDEPEKAVGRRARAGGRVRAPGGGESRQLRQGGVAEMDVRGLEERRHREARDAGRPGGVVKEEARPEGHLPARRIVPEGRHRRMAHQLREEAVEVRGGLRYLEDVGLDVDAAPGDAAVASRLVRPKALDELVRPPGDAAARLEPPLRLDLLGVPELGHEAGTGIVRRRHGPGGRRQMTNSATGVPPTRCSVMIRSRTGGSQEWYQTPSG